MYMPTTMGGQTVRGGAAMHPMPINQPYLQQQFQHQSQVFALYFMDIPSLSSRKISRHLFSSTKNLVCEGLTIMCFLKKEKIILGFNFGEEVISIKYLFAFLTFSSFPATISSSSIAKRTTYSCGSSNFFTTTQSNNSFQFG